MLACTNVQKSYRTTPRVGVGICVGFDVGVNKMLKFLCDGQDAESELSYMRTGLVTFSPGQDFQKVKILWPSIANSQYHMQ